MKNFMELNDGELLVFFQPSLITENKILTDNEKNYLNKLDEIE